jgi:hypothetical protein
VVGVQNATVWQIAVRLGFLTLPAPSRRVRPALIDRDSQDVSVIALAAIEGPDIEAGWSARDAHECHRGAAFGAISTLNGGEREAGGLNGLRHQPFNVCAFSHFWFFRSLRRDKAVCRC